MALRLIAIFATASLFATCEPVDDQTSSPDRSIEWDSAPGFWIWNRPKALTKKSVEELRTANSTHLYWQVAEIFSDGRLSRIPDPDLIAHLHGISAIPVIRLSPVADTLTDEATRTGLEKTCVRLFANPTEHRHLQIDFDCPISALEAYAKFLSKIRSQFQLDELSVTALASWIDAPEFRALAASVDELVPMFYDLEPDTPAGILAGTPVPMLDKTTLRWIERWKRCQAPWRAGLPNFQRLTLFESDGNLIGHHRSWSPEFLLTHPALKISSSQREGITHFQIAANGNLLGTAIQKGQRLLWRMPDETLADLAVKTAREAGASGTVWFAHPDSAPVAWHSVTHLSALQHGKSTAPDPAVHVASGGAIVLTNRGPGDFSPRIDPWQLVLETASPGEFGAADPGRFSSIDSPGASLTHPEFSRKMVLQFQSLRAHGELRSGSGLILPSDSHHPSSIPDSPTKPPPWHILPVQ